MADKKEQSGNILKEYLVKLGYFSDEKALKQILAGLKGLGSEIKGTIPKMMQWMKGMIDMDNEMTRTARHMLTSRENAYALTTSLNAMGKEFNSLDDILNMTQAEYREFVELQKAYKSIGVPEDYLQTMQTGRDLLLDINKIRVQFQAGLRRLAYILLKQFQEPIQKFRGWLKEIQNRMPDIIDKVGRFVITVAHHISNIAKGLMEIGEFISEKLPNSLKRLVPLFAAIGLALLKGRFGMFMLAVSALLLLIDDFMTWKSGGKSFFGDNWKVIGQMKDQIDEFKNSKTWETIQNFLLGIWAIVKGIFDIVNDLIHLDVKGFVQKSIDGTYLKKIFDYIGMLAPFPMRLAGKLGSTILNTNDFIKGADESKLYGNFTPYQFATNNNLALGVNVNVDKSGNVATTITDNGRTVANATNNASYQMHTSL